MNNSQDFFDCEKCKKKYSSKVSLDRHYKLCNTPTPPMNTLITEELANTLIKTVDALREELKVLKETNSKMTPSNITNNTTNNTNNYITIQELKVYLNTECKDAKTIFDFIENMNMTVAEKCELELSNYNTAVTNIWKRNYLTLSKNERPLYCVPTAESELTIFAKGDEHWLEQPETEFMTKLDIKPQYMHETMYATTAVNETCYKVCEMYEDKMDNDEEIIKKLTPKSKGPELGEWKERKVHIWNEICKFDAELRENRK
jgi:hypothetical protein